MYKYLNKRFLDKKYNILFILLMIITAMVKVLIIMQSAGPIVYGDELLYKRRAAEIFYHYTYQGVHYPVGYPLIISIAFFFRDNFYLAMKIINVTLSQLAIFGIWKIARLFLNERKSFWCTFVTALLPFSYLMCNRIMSENLYYPLIVFSFYTFLIAKKENTLKSKIMLGCLLLGMHLTRHITIVLLPIFLFLWMIDNSEEGKWGISLNKKKVMELSQIFGVYALGYSIWVIFMLYQGIDLFKVLGLNVAGGIDDSGFKEFITVKSLLQISILYVSYYVLSLLFTIPHLIAGTLVLFKNITNKLFVQFVLLCALVSGVLTVTVIRHTWISWYNYPIIYRIMGRYIYYVIPLWFIIFFVYMSLFDVNIKKKSLIATHLCGTILFYASFQCIVRGRYFLIRENLLDDFNTKELYFIKDLYILLILIWVIGFFVLLFNHRVYNHIMVVALAVILVIGTTQSIKADDYGRGGVFGAELNKFNKEYGLINYDFVINVTGDPNIEAAIDFWTIHTDRPIIMGYNTGYKEVNAEEYYKRYWPEGVYVKLINFSNGKDISEDVRDKKGIVLCETNELYLSKAYRKFESGGVNYGIYNYPIKLKEAPRIIQTYPNVINVGEKFNEQPDGSSALVIETNFYNQEIEVYINDHIVGKIHTSDKGVGVVTLWEELYSKPEKLNIKIRAVDEMLYEAMNEGEEFIVLVNEKTN